MDAFTYKDMIDLLESEGLLVRAASADPAMPITGAACDSRAVRPGNAFFCKGRAFKSAFLASAIDAGACCYLCEEELASTLEQDTAAPAIIVSDIRSAMASVSPLAWGHPDHDIEVLGLTGTKGKSTTAYMLRSIFDDGVPGSRASIMGSIDTYDGIEELESVNTTPEAPDMWRHLANARDSQHSPMVMEVSSHGLKYQRVEGLRLTAAAFLNLGRDHISPIEHPDFEDYFQSKLRIFEHSDTAVINLGTDRIDEVMAAARAACKRIISFSDEDSSADVWADGIASSYGRVQFTAHTPYWSVPVELGMPGLFNVENALCAIAMAWLCGASSEQIARGLARARVPGRMELLEVGTDSITGLVDYAHNTLSYQRFFSSVTKEFPGAKIAVVMGAPGDKAQERRRELPIEASKWADLLIYTEEDPAHERVEDICAEMAENTPAGQDFIVEPDRAVAIRRAVERAVQDGGDWLVCLLAKADETYQHRGDVFEETPTDAEMFEDALRGLSLID